MTKINVVKNITMCANSNVKNSKESPTLPSSSVRKTPKAMNPIIISSTIYDNSSR